MNCEDGTGCLSQWASGFGPVLSVEDCPEPLFFHAGEKNSERNECEACRGKAGGGGGGERSVSCWHPVLSRFDRAFNNQIKIRENKGYMYSMNSLRTPSWEKIFHCKGSQKQSEGKALIRNSQQLWWHFWAVFKFNRVESSSTDQEMGKNKSNHRAEVIYNPLYM